MNAAVSLKASSAVGNDDDDYYGEDSSNVYDGEVETTAHNTKDLKGVFTSLLLMEEHDKQDHESRHSDSRRQMLDFQSNYRKRARAMSDYYSDLHDHYTDADESSRISRKKSRAAAAAAVATAAAGSELENESGDNSNPGTGSRRGSGPAQQRRLWVKDRSRAWWDDCSREDYPEEDFKRAFRMSKATFETICEELNSAVAKEDTALRNAIPVRQRVAVCIWRLATGEPLRLVSKKFGLGISTCHKLVLEVCKAIKDVLMPKYFHCKPSCLSLSEQHIKVSATQMGSFHISSSTGPLSSTSETTQCNSLSFGHAMHFLPKARRSCDFNGLLKTTVNKTVYFHNNAL